MFIYVYADIKTLFQPEIPEQIISGIVGGMTINQSFLFAAAILMSIPTNYDYTLAYSKAEHKQMGKHYC